MSKIIHTILFLFFSYAVEASSSIDSGKITAQKILGNPAYRAICYGGYRTSTRDVVPTVGEIKEDMRILAAMKIKIVRTYNVHFKEIHNLLEATVQLQKEQKGFEMYVMLGAWIDCKNAWSSNPIHNEESERNAVEIAEAVRLSNKYPDIIKIIAVGNEAMVKWATSYYVEPKIILKWVKHLQALKQEGKLSKELWITSSDNFASWGGGTNDYHIADLNELIKAVDYVSIHTYPMHDTHYNPSFWGIKENEQAFTDKEKANAMMLRARDYAIAQYNSVVKYLQSIGQKKPVHIGETGWATFCNELYGKNGSKAVDEYKAALYYQFIAEWTKKQSITCFYFEAFDEKWKNSANPLHSENYFGLINMQAEAKFVIWNLVDDGVFKGLTRNGKLIKKTYNGNQKLLWADVIIPDKRLKN